MKIREKKALVARIAEPTKEFKFNEVVNLVPFGYSKGQDMFLAKKGETEEIVSQEQVKDLAYE